MLPCFENLEDDQCHADETKDDAKAGDSNKYGRQVYEGHEGVDHGLWQGGRGLEPEDREVDGRQGLENVLYVRVRLNLDVEL